MKKIIIPSFIILILAISFNCSKNISSPDQTKVKFELPETPYAYNISQTPAGIKSNFYEDNTLINNNKATIGRVLFYDKALSINNTVACANCHLQNVGFADVTAFSVGFEEKNTVRNSIGINNLFDERNIGYFWDLRETKIEDMVLKPIANHIEMGFERIDLIAEKVSNLTYYKELFKKYYGDEAVTSKRIQESLGNFLFSIVSNNSKFDIGVQTNFANFTNQEKNGKTLFVNNGCNNCHMISSSFPTGYGSGGGSNNGGLNKTGNIGLDVVDMDKGNNGAYKIPRLKNVAKTAPYMHDGRFNTLAEVLDHYSTDIKSNPSLSANLKVIGTNNPKKFNFSEQNKLDLIAFLNTLTDETLCTDPKFSNPFR
jgi:cytochrome c peroxidase